MSFRNIHKKGGGTGGRVICSRHIWIRLIREAEVQKKKQSRFKQKRTKRRPAIRYNSGYKGR